MLDFCLEDLDLLSEEEFERLEQMLDRQIAIIECSNLAGTNSILWDDQHIGQKRRELQALDHPSVDKEAVLAFRRKAVVDSLEGNMLVHALTGSVIEVDADNTRARASFWSFGHEGLSKFREKPMAIFSLGVFNDAFIKTDGEWKILYAGWQRTTKNEYHKGWARDMQPTNTRPPMTPEEDRAMLGRFAYQPDEIRQPVPEPPRRDTWTAFPDEADREWVNVNIASDAKRGDSAGWIGRVKKLEDKEKKEK